jgi:hypothetical protein
MFEFFKKLFGKKEELTSSTGNPDTATTLALTTDVTSANDSKKDIKDPDFISDAGDDYGGEAEDFDF